MTRKTEAEKGLRGGYTRKEVVEFLEVQVKAHVGQIDERAVSWKSEERRAALFGEAVEMLRGGVWRSEPPDEEGLWWVYSSGEDDPWFAEVGLEHGCFFWQKNGVDVEYDWDRRMSCCRAEGPPSGWKD